MVDGGAESNLFCPELRNFMKNRTEFRNFISLLETENWAFFVRKNGIYIKIVKISGVFTKTIHFKDIFGAGILILICPV